MKYTPTVSQQLIWLDQLISGTSSKYNIGGYASLEGALSYPVFHEAIRNMLRSQEAYASLFNGSTGELICETGEAVDGYEAALIDFSAVEDPEQAAAGWMREDFARAFETENNYLFFFKLLKISEEKHYWYAKIHHLISDGWSFKLLLNQTADVYDALIREQDLTLPVYRYSDYAGEDEAYYQSVLADQDRAYWLSEYEQLPGELLLPDYRQNHTGEADSHTLFLSAAVKKALEQFAEEQKCSVFHTILSILLIYFSRTRSQDEIAIGMPVLNRTKKIYRHTAGVFMNLLPLKFSIKENDTFREVLGKVKQKMSASLRHQRYQYGRLAKDLKLPLNKLLYDIRISYEDFDFSSDFGGLATHAVALSNHAEADKLALYLRDYHAEGFDVRFVYNTSYFDKAGIQSLARSLEHIISDLPLSLDKEINQIALLSETDLNNLLPHTTGEIKERKEQSFAALWQQIVTLYPQHIAISAETGAITYEILHNKAVRIAAALQYHIKENKAMVALLLPRSADFIAGMLGSIMAGVAYIPLDPELPEQRIADILEDAGCSLMLVTEATKHKLTHTSHTRCLDLQEIYTIPDPDKFAAKITGDMPCYIIYTSGSTGIPKGVVISHASVIDYVHTFKAYFRLTNNDVLLQQASLSFDTSVEEIFPILGTGGRLHIIGDRKDLSEVKRTLEEEQITVFSTNPWVLKFLNGSVLPAALRILISGGDILKPEYIDRITGANIAIYNTYGPTESTVCATYYKVTGQEKVIPIGKPIHNREVYILDNARQLQPVGVEGEIYLGGAGLALEYINNPALTAERFVEHIAYPHKKLYRTGDLGILSEDGNIFFRGRKDEQLNYRGYRIEAAEVEKAINGFADVEDSIVVVQAYQEIPVLVAYIKYQADSEYTIPQRRQSLARKLPAYMVPDIWVPVTEFPLLHNGKINKAALPDFREHLQTNNGDESVPASDMEKKLLQIWRTLLQRSAIGMHDSFFELGGHSLNIMQLVNSYQREFEVNVAVSELFEHTTIASHVVLIAGKSATPYQLIRKVTTNIDYAVSDGQRRLWTLSQLEEHSRAYHLSGKMIFTTAVNPSHLEEAILQVISRHEILRTVFRENESGELRQLVLPVEDTVFILNSKDGTELEDADIIAYMEAETRKPFSLANGPLLRAGLILQANGHYLFYYALHHIVSDGWSMEVLKKEMMDYYTAYAAGTTPVVSPLNFQYKDYVAWKEEKLGQETLTGLRDYWLEQLRGELPVLSLPSAKGRPSFLTNNGRLLSVMLGREQTKSLRDLCSRHNVTLFMALLATLKALFYRYAAQEDVIIGCPVAGRDHAALDNQIGFYINTLVMRTRFNGNDSFTALLQKVKQVTLQAFEHQLYPFDRLVEELHLKRDMSRSPLFDVSMILQNQHDRNEDHNDSTLEVTDKGTTASKFDLSFEFWEGTDDLRMNLEFNTDIYEKREMTRLMEHFNNLLNALINSPDAPLHAAGYLSAAEKHELLVTFNDTFAAYPVDKTVVDLFTEQAQRTPELTAVIFEHQKLTYSELHHQSNLLAHYLVEQGCGRESRVPVFIDRSPEMIVAILAVLKSGAAYVPIDTTYPEARVSYILSDVDAEWMITQQKYRDVLSPFIRTRKIFVDEPNVSSAINLLPAGVMPSDLAYIIYTSGSTGQPKGVMIEHAGLVNFILGQISLLELKSGMGMLQFASLSFDASCYEIFSALLSGGFLMIPSVEEMLSVEVLAALINKHHLSTTLLPPAFQPLLLKEDISSFATIISGGDAIDVQAGLEIQSRNIRLVNAYGPTEITVCGCFSKQPILENGKTTIGKPVPNMHIYILDGNMHLLPVGVPGELYIGGPGVARGYLNKPALTTERFVNNPYNSNGAARLYRTGDLGRWLPDGNIEYLGRADDQVKIRGYRIEPGEIEQALRQLPGIELAAVVVKEKTDKEKQLQAYLKCLPDIDFLSVRQQLLKQLPEYMIPGAFIRLEEMPLTASGKIDKQKMMTLAGIEMNKGTAFIAPRTETEITLVNIFGELLGVANISVGDSFFDLGGNSMLLIKSNHRIMQEFGIKLSIRDMYKRMTIAELADIIDAIRWMRHGETSDQQQNKEEFSV